MEYQDETVFVNYEKLDQTCQGLSNGYRQHYQPYTLCKANPPCHNSKYIHHFTESYDPASQEHAEKYTDDCQSPLSERQVELIQIKNISQKSTQDQSVLVEEKIVACMGNACIPGDDPQSDNKGRQRGSHNHTAA